MGKGAGKGEGKGKGKGGCELLQDGCECLEGLICCVCLLLVLGPILIIVGVVFLGSATKDTRGQKINDVKDAVKFWTDDAVNGGQAFQKASFSATLSTSGCSGVAISGTYPLALTVSQGDAGYSPGSAPAGSDVFYDGGSKFKYQQARHVFNGATKGIAFPESVTDTSCSLAVTITSNNKTTVGSFSQPFRTQRDIASSLYGVEGCPTGGLTGSSSTNTYSTKYRACQQACLSRQGRFISTSGSSTFQCLVVRGFSRVCIRVTANGNAWIEDKSKPASGQGCFVPFLNTAFQVANFTSRSGNNAIVVEVRSSADPYLKYQVVTKGTGYFGLTRGQKVRIGLGCIVVGALLMSCWCLICWASWSVCCSKKRPAARPANPVQGFAYDVANKYGNKLGIQPGYPVAGPPPPGYPQVNPPPPQHASAAVPPPAQYGPPGGQAPQYGAPPQYPPPAQGYPAPYGGQQPQYPPPGQQYPQYPPPGQYPPQGQYPQYPPQGQYPPPHQ